MSASSSDQTPFGRALRNVGWLLTGKGVGAVLSLFYLALATRSLGVERFGQFTLVLSTGQAIAAFVAFQTWQIMISYGMQPLRDGNRAALGRLVRICLALDLGGAIVGCGLAAIAILVMTQHFGWSPHRTENAMTFCFVLILTFRSTPVGILRLHDKYRLGALADSVTPIARFIGATAAVAINPTTKGFLIVWGAAEILTAIAYWFAAWWAAPGLLRAGLGSRAEPGEHPGLARFAISTNLNSTLNALSKQFIVVLVGFVTGPIAAGNYRLAYQLSQSLTRVSEMFSRGVFPEFTRANTADTRDDLRRLFRQSTRLSLIAGGTICVVAPLLGGPAVKLIAGHNYDSAYPILTLLAIAAGLEVMGTGFEPVLIGTGRAGAALRIRLASVAALFVGAVVLMPRYGEIGAGGATLLASAVGLVLFGRIAYRATYRAG